MSLQIFTLGPFRILRDGVLLQSKAWTTRKNLELVQILLTWRNRSVSQEVLMEWLWPDLPPKRAARNLRVAISQARRTLEPGLTKGSDSSYLLTGATGYSWNPVADCYIDAEEFDQQLTILRQEAENLSTSDFAARAQAALALYQGAYLAELYYADWVTTRRAQLQDDFLWLLARLAKYHAAQEDYAGAIDLCRRLLAVDNCQEHIWRWMMSYHWQVGDTAAALRAYTACRETLARELDVQPMPETVAMAEEIRRSVADSIPRLPLRSDAFVPTYPLPTPLTPLIGRDELIEIVLRRLLDPTCRLLTLIGAGGIGKTRLAVACAHRLTKDVQFQEGVAFIDLASVTEDERLFSAMVGALNLPMQESRPLKAQLADFLAEREMLLVLDNFEQLATHVDPLLDLLAYAPRLKLLFTSRRPLNVHGEWLVEVGPLAYPAENERADLELHPSLRLFLASAERIQPGFADDPNQTDSSADICRLVAGNPLAIELAASLVRQHSSAAIAAGIRRSHRFLHTTLRGMPERHRSIAALFDHSWRLLTDQEQRVFSRLSVFAGGWDAEAAFAVAGASRSLLTALCDKLLIRHVGEGRYQMHELLRQFAADRLAGNVDDQVKAQSLHGIYFANFIQHYGLALRGKDQQQALECCRLDLDNVHVAWRWALNQGAWTDLTKLVQGLHVFYRVRSRFQEGAALLAETVQRQDGIEKRDPYRLQALAAVLVRLGDFHVGLGDFDSARHVLEEGLALAHDQGNQADVALALVGLGTAAQQQGHYAEAEHLYREAQDHYEQAGDAWGVAHVLNALGVVAARTGRFAEAEARYGEGMERYAVAGDRWSMTQPANNLAILAYTNHNYPQAQALFQRNLPVFQEVGDVKGEALTLSNLGTLAREQHDLHAAREYYLRSLDLFGAIGNRWAIANAHANLGVVHVALHEPVEARLQFQQALIQAQTLQAEPLLLYVFVGCAQLFAALRRSHQARTLLDYALSHPALKAETRLLAESLWVELDLSGANPGGPSSPEFPTSHSHDTSISTVVERLLNDLASS